MCLQKLIGDPVVNETKNTVFSTDQAMSLTKCLYLLIRSNYMLEYTYYSMHALIASVTNHLKSFTIFTFSLKILS